MMGWQAIMSANSKIDKKANPMPRKSQVVLLLVLLVGGVVWWPNQTTTAQRPDAPTYAQRGPYDVGTQELEIEDETRPLQITVWYPTAGQEVAHTYRYSLLQLEGNALLNGPILTTERYPLVVFSHGSGGYRLQSLYLTEHLASYGFVVVAADHVGNTVLDETNFENLTLNFALRPIDVLRQIEFMTANNDALFGGMIDTDQVAVAGHSFGGYTAFASAGAQIHTGTLNEVGRYTGNGNDVLPHVATARGLPDVPAELWPSTTVPNIKAVVGLAPAFSVAFGEEGLAAVDVPALLVVGSADLLTPPASEAEVFYNTISSQDRHLAIFENAGHFVFANACTPIMVQGGFFNACSDPVWDMQRAHDLTNHLTTAFLLAYLQNEGDALAALAPNAVDFVGVQYQSSER